MLHGTWLMINLLVQWHHDGEYVVRGGSHFDSVSAVIEVKKLGLQFIGVIKTATK